MTFLKHCWYSEKPFDFEGRFFHGRDVYVSPKPTRKPRPILLNAGFSPAGIDFAAKDCDWLFTSGTTAEKLGDLAGRAKSAAGKYKRDLRVVTFAWSIWAETDAKAEQEYKLAEEMLDEHATSWFAYRSLDQPGTKAGASFAPAIADDEEPTMRRAVGEEAFKRVGLGLQGYHMIGGYDSVAEQIRTLYADHGQEGLLVAWFDPLRGLHQLEDHIIPRLRKMGLRK